MTRRTTDIVYTDNGKTASWSAIRRHVLDRDPTCRICGVHRSTEVDHIWPLHYGGTDQSKNVQGVCRQCNVAKGDRVDAASARVEHKFQACRAVLGRIGEELTELDRFLEPLLSDSIGADAGKRAEDQSPEHALNVLRLVGSLLREHAARLGSHSDFVAEWIDDADQRGTPIDSLAELLAGVAP